MPAFINVSTCLCMCIYASQLYEKMGDLGKRSSSSSHVYLHCETLAFGVIESYDNEDIMLNYMTIKEEEEKEEEEKAIELKSEKRKEKLFFLTKNSLEKILLRFFYQQTCHVV